MADMIAKGRGNWMRKHKSELCDLQLKVWVTQALFEKIQSRAMAEDRSLGNMARRILEEATAEQDARSEAA